MRKAFESLLFFLRFPLDAVVDEEGLGSFSGRILLPDPELGPLLLPLWRCAAAKPAAGNASGMCVFTQYLARSGVELYFFSSCRFSAAFFSFFFAAFDCRATLRSRVRVANELTAASECFRGMGADVSCSSIGRAPPEVLTDLPGSEEVGVPGVVADSSPVVLVFSCC